MSAMKVYSLLATRNTRSIGSGPRDTGYYYVNGKKVYYEKPAGYIFEEDAKFALHGSQTAFSVLYPDGVLPWVEGTRKTGTVYDNIKITQPVYEGTQIPKSFEITTANGQKMWVHPNATEHMFEYVTRNLNHSRNINSQQMLSSFESALNQAVKNGVQFDKMIKVGNWEFKFAAPRGEGLLPVVKHAQYIP
jgi:hypothetical protein